MAPVLKLASIALLLGIALPAPQAQAATKKTDELAGAQLFQAQDCAHCHGPAGIGGTKKGPDLSQIRKDKQWPPDKIAQQILNGGKKMPPFSEALTDQQIGQVVAYLRAKHRPAPPAPQTPAINAASPQ